MDIALTQDGSRTIARIGGELTIYCATDFKNELLAALAQFDQLELDLAAVAEIDTAGLQIIELSRCEAAARGARLVVAATSSAVDEAAGLLGIELRSPAALESTS